jgi:UDP-2,3-diacylglucosamine pyrophosphatase LpxH
MTEVNTVLFSDVHLGLPSSRAYELLNTLKEYRFKRLVIVGDMFDDLNFEFLRSTHWELLEHIGKVSRRNVEVVWIEGNHDAKFYPFISHLIGIPVYKEYIWHTGGRKFMALHGHQFDSFITNDKFLGRFLGWIYTKVQRVISSHFFDFIFMKITDRWLRMTEQVADNAIMHARKKHCDVVVCGHTHFAHNINKNGVEYYNLGCWNNKPSHLLIIEDSGKSYYRILD